MEEAVKGLVQGNLKLTNDVKQWESAKSARERIR